MLSQVAGFAADKTPSASLDQYLKSLKYGSVPFARQPAEHCLVNARIGQQKVRLLVDSGCARTSLSPPSAKGLKTLGQLGVTLNDSLFGETTDPDVVLIDKLTLGEAQFFNQPAQVEALSFEVITTPFGGILGADFLLRNHCLADFGSGRLYFRSEKISEQECSRLGNTLKQSGLLEVPLQRLGLIWVVRVKVNGEFARLMVDTGADLTMLDESQIERLSLTMGRNSGLEVVGLGKIGRHKVRVASLNKLEMGSRQWSKVKCGMLDLDPWLKDLSLLRPEGLLGRDFLLSQHALVDFACRKLWLAPQIARKTPPEP